MGSSINSDYLYSFKHHNILTEYISHCNNIININTTAIQGLWIIYFRTSLLLLLLLLFIIIIIIIRKFTCRRTM